MQLKSDFLRQEANSAVEFCTVQPQSTKEVLDPVGFQLQIEKIDTALKELKKQIDIVGRGIELYERVFGIKAEKVNETTLRFEFIPLENMFVELSIQGSKFSLVRSSPFLSDSEGLIDELNHLQRLDVFLLRFIEKAVGAI